MSWLYLDDHFGEDPRLLRVGADAAWMHTQAMSYCARLLTDGQISEPVARTFSSRYRALACKLEAEAIWQRVEGGWALPDFIAWNKTRAEVEKAREERSEAGRKGGLKSGEMRSKGEATASAPASVFASANVEPQSRPVPSPVPKELRESVSLAQQPAGFSARAAAAANQLLAIKGSVLSLADTQALVDKLTDEYDSSLVFTAIETLSDVSEGFTATTRAGQIAGVMAWVKRQKPPLVDTVSDLLARVDNPQWIWDEAGLPDDGPRHASRESLETALKLLRQEWPEMFEGENA